MKVAASKLCWFDLYLLNTMDAVLGQLSSGGKKLKKSAVIKDSSAFDKQKAKKKLEEAQALQSVTGIHSEEDRRKYFFEAGMDGWYDNLKAFTFASSFLPLSEEEAQTIQKIYFGEKTDIRNLRPLEQRLDECIKKEHNGSAFVKLSSRSPKDSVSIFERAVQRFKDLDKASMTENEKWIALSESVRLACKVTNGAEAIAILLDSRRVAEDLKYAANAEESGGDPQQKQAEGRIDVSLVVRSFDDDVTAKTEFRGFVWNNKFTCVGQYFHQLHFPELMGKAEVIRNDLQAFFKEIQPHVPVPCYMMDLVWFGPNKTPMLVEINPFDGEGLGAFPASTGLFDWDNDRAVMKGEKPFELRLRTEEPTTEEMANVNPKWAAIVRASDAA